MASQFPQQDTEEHARIQRVKKTGKKNEERIEEVGGPREIERKYGKQCRKER